MQISPVSSFNNGQYKNNPSFSSRFLIDVGGSVGENSLKALIIPNKSNKTIYKMKNIDSNFVKSRPPSIIKEKINNNSFLLFLFHI